MQEHDPHKGAYAEGSPVHLDFPWLRREESATRRELFAVIGGAAAFFITAGPIMPVCSAATEPAVQEPYCAPLGAPGGHVADSACTKAIEMIPYNQDEGCSLIPGATKEAADIDPDNACGPMAGSSYDVDNSCGDCDDDHESDESCGLLKSNEIEYESDELCGHAHVFSGTTDSACKQGSESTGFVQDAGCGNHVTDYQSGQGGWFDTDNTCNQPTIKDPEANYANQYCGGSTRTGADLDQTCNANNPQFSTSPDEGCSWGDTGPGHDYDQACGQSGAGTSKAYDKDEGCGWGNDQDQGCGANSGYGHDSDSSCNIGSDYEDESCTLDEGGDQSKK